MPDPTPPEPLIDPDCRDGKCGSCVGGPCQHWCHTHGQAAPERPTPPDDTEGLREYPYCAFCEVPLSEHPEPLCSPGIVRDLRAEVARLRAAKRHLSERISLGQEGWNELHREVERQQAELAERTAELAQALRRAGHAEGELASRRDHETRWEIERQKREAAETKARWYRNAWQSARSRAKRYGDICRVYGRELNETLTRAGRAENDRDFQKARKEQAEAERDTLRETLAETDLGGHVLAQWEAIAAADADRDRLEGELAKARAAAEQFAAEGNADLARFNQYREWTAEVVAERDALKAAIERVRNLHQPMTHGGITICGHCAGWNGFRCRGVVQPMPCPTLADLDAPEPEMRAVSVASPGNDGFRYEPVAAPETPGDAKRAVHAFEQNPEATQVRVCVCGKWPDHHVHGAYPCGCDACRTPGDAEEGDRWRLT